MAQEVKHALQIAHNIACLYECSNHRLWYPRFSLAWLGVAPQAFILDERNGTAAADIPNVDTSLSAEEVRQGIDEQYGVANIPNNNLSLSIPIAERIPRVGRTSSLHRALRMIPNIWRDRRILHIRLCASKIIRAIQHSSHLRHALKNAFGVTLLGLPAFLPTGSAGQYFIGSDVLVPNQ